MSNYYDEVVSIEHQPVDLQEAFLMKSLNKLRAATGQSVKILDVEGNRARVVIPKYQEMWLDIHAGEYGLSFPVGEDEKPDRNFLCLGE